MCRSTSRRSGSARKRRGCGTTIRAWRCCRSRPISPNPSACRARSPGWRAPASFRARPSAISKPHQACAFLRHAARILGEDAILIVGIDLVKDAETLTAAYNDAAGVTAKFNLNLLARINRELGADFDLAGFCHQAFYNRERQRIEMHLASRIRQRVQRLRPHHRVPRRRDHPHREQLQIHRRIASARWRAAAAGRRSRPGAMRTDISRSRRCGRRNNHSARSRLSPRGRRIGDLPEMIWPDRRRLDPLRRRHAAHRQPPRRASSS